jgi:hypothetical protein
MIGSETVMIAITLLRRGSRTYSESSTSSDPPNLEAIPASKSTCDLKPDHASGHKFHHSPGEELRE